jgi:hypothetical protein
MSQRKAGHYTKTRGLTEQLRFSVNGETMDQLRKLAMTKGTNISQLVRGLIDKELKANGVRHQDDGEQVLHPS